MSADIPQESACKADIRASENKRNKSKRILIVDDDSDFRWILSEALEPFAETIDAVCNGCEAVEQIKRQNYDAVLMDMHMPCKDGLQALREMRQMDREMKIFILTLAPTSEMMQDVYLEHADGFFVKPVFIEDMEPLIEQLIIRIWGLDNELVEADYIDGFWRNLKRKHEEEANN